MIDRMAIKASIGSTLAGWKSEQDEKPAWEVKDERKIAINRTIVMRSSAANARL